MDEKRKVLFTNGMSNDYMIIITDASKESIEKWCYHYNQEMENGENAYFDTLKRNYSVKVLADSEIDNFDREDIDIIGYSEAYDLSDYTSEIHPLVGKLVRSRKDGKTHVVTKVNSFEEDMFGQGNFAIITDTGEYLYECEIETLERY